MSSELIVDELTGRASAGSIAVTAEGGTNTTNLQQGLAKAWINYKTAATFVNNDSFNIASITDEGTGQVLHNFTNAMSNTFFSYIGMSNEFTATGSLTNKSSSTARQHSYNTSDAAADTNENNTAVHGDLA
tara:strand:+ start:38 stop:430 length:393 start_codon:yes stop_codon:yes gene_type:complete